MCALVISELVSDAEWLHTSYTQTYLAWLQQERKGCCWLVIQPLPQAYIVGMSLQKHICAYNEVSLSVSIS